jgi:hypothetical protein
MSKWDRDVVEPDLPPKSVSVSTHCPPTSTSDPPSPYLDCALFDFGLFMCFVIYSLVLASSERRLLVF